MGLGSKLFGTHSEHEIKRIMPLVKKIEGYHDDMQKLSDERKRPAYCPVDTGCWANHFAGV